MDAAKQIELARRRRGYHRGTITRSTKKLEELEARGRDPSTLIPAKQLLKTIEAADFDFKRHHASLINLLESDEDLTKERDVLDTHDETVNDLLTRVDHLIASSTTPGGNETREIAFRRILRLEQTLTDVGKEVDKLEADPEDICIIKQREEQIRELKQELSDVTRVLVSLGLSDKDELMVRQKALESPLFENSLKLKRMYKDLDAKPTSDHGIKLPKIAVPTFNGDILAWKPLWEQFTVAVHSRTDISNSEKLVYLRHSVKDGTAKSTTEGLSRTGDNYDEAIECLKTRYDKPRLIHQTHVRKILDIPSLKNGSSKELRYLHNTALQHLRALKSMGSEPSGPFITSVLELKLDPATMFEWQRDSSTLTDTPHYDEFLKFINLRAQASEHSVIESSKRTHSELKKGPQNKSFAAHTANISQSMSEPCVLCKTVSHPLYSCSKFKALPHDRKTATVKSNDLCINCLRPGHFVNHCKSLHKCHECQKPYHTLLHLNPKTEDKSQQGTSATSNHATAVKPSSLLMTCQITVTSPTGFTVKARALLDAGSSTSFISDRLTKALHLRRCPQPVTISGIAGITHGGSSYAVTSFQVSPLHQPSKQFSVSAIIVPRVTCKLPTCPVSADTDWSHLQGLALADPSFSQPSTVDILLDVDIFVATLLDGQRSGLQGAPSALETEFGWVLAGGSSLSQTLQTTSHHATLLIGDDLLRRFWEIEDVPPEFPAMSPRRRQ